MFHVFSGAYAQKLSGHVTDCRYKEVLAGAQLKLLEQKEIIDSTITDTSGFYFFVDKDLKPGTNYTLICGDPDRPKPAPFGICPFAYLPDHYLHLSETDTFTTSGDKIPDKPAFDFCLSPVIIDYYLPGFYFVKNTLFFCRGEGEYAFYAGDTAVDCLADFMKSHPSYMVELDGHADKREKKRKSLSEARAKTVFDSLVVRGIAPARIVCKAWGAKRPAEKDTNNDGKVDGHYRGLMNRRVVVYILRKDYSIQEKEEEGE